MSKVIEIVRYTPSLRSLWDDTVKQARQSSFLFERIFMDYHKQRFEDVSLIAFDIHKHPLALFPACISRHNPNTIESHGGLTYGGLLLTQSITTEDVENLFERCFNFYNKQGFKELIYKPVPHIYHLYPAEEDLYWLYRYGATLLARSVSSVIDLRNPISFSTLRKRKVHKAEKEENFILSDDMERLQDFWEILTNVLQKRHNTNPVHTFQEISSLIKYFPKQIKLYTVLQKDKTTFHVIAGCLLFITKRVVHAQYIAANDEACKKNALDWLFQQIILQFKNESSQHPWFDFGISTEKSGTFLNKGLIFQKEGFGARAICYDAYKINL